jgi:membrane fusion protein, heavy metal efflux system
MKPSQNPLIYCLLLAAPTIAFAATPAARSDILGCLLTPQAEVDVGSPVVGVLAKVLIDRGDSVKKGQLLAQLVDDVERATVKSSSQRFENKADVAAAKAAYEFAQKKANNADELLAQKFISQQAHDQAVAEAQVAAMRYAQTQEQRIVAREELAVANAQLALRSITAPFSGVVVERYLQAGARVEDKPIAKLAQIDPLHAEVVVSASRFGSIRKGSLATLTPDLQGSTPVNVKVSRVDAVIDAASNTFRVRLTVPNPGEQIPSGLRCQVSFDASPVR